MLIIDDLSVRLGGVRKKPRDRLVGFGADTRVVPVSRQPPTGLRAPRNDADPLGRAERQHFTLLAFGTQEVPEQTHVRMVALPSWSQIELATQHMDFVGPRFIRG